MKALQSPLTKLLLADPDARVQLRRAMIATTTGGPASDSRVTIHQNGKDVSYRLTVVPKAA